MLDQPSWYLLKNKVFRASDAALPLDGRAFVAQRGYSASLKACMAGLVLVSGSRKLIIDNFLRLV
jgi:hypothetical protein